MKVFTAREAQNHFGDLMMQAIKEPVAISKHGKEALVVMSQQEYMKFSHLEDAYLVAMSEEAIAEGVLSEEESSAFLDSLYKKLDQ